MRYYSFFILIICFGMLACKKNEVIIDPPSNNDPVVQEDTSITYPDTLINNPDTSMALIGDWYMIRFQGYLSPFDTIPYGYLRWTFDTAQLQLIIQNDYTSTIYPYLSPTDTLPYTTNNSDSIFVTRDGLILGYKYYFQDSQLYIINSPESDGPIHTFKR